MPRETIGLPPDERLAEMVKTSGYVIGSNFAADAMNRQRYLVVLALPYEDREASSVCEALENFIQLLRDGEEEGTMFQAYDAYTGEFHENVTIQDLRASEEDANGAEG
mgnify:CR=1 FL=1